MGELYSLSIEDFVKYANEKATKIPIFGNNNYEFENFQYYDKLHVLDNNKERCPKNRLSYEVIWDKEKEKIAFILFNPSHANAKELDGTLKNCVRICYALNKELNEKIGGIVIYNTFTTRHPKIEEAIKLIKLEYEKLSNPIFKLADELSEKNISKVIIAWGNDAKNKLKEEYFNAIKTAINNEKNKDIKFFAYRINKKTGQPTHPSPRCAKYVNEFCENPKLENVLLEKL